MAEDDWKQIHESEEQAREARRRKWDPFFQREPQLATVKLATRICFAGSVPPCILLIVWKWHHLHTFEERDGGTLVKDCVDYAVLGGSLVHWLAVKRDLERIFAFRHQKLIEFLGQPVTAVADA